MSAFRRMFSRPYRHARAAEGAGNYRKAAGLYAEAGYPAEAARALLFLANRSHELGEKLSAYEDALRWLPEDSKEKHDVQARIGTEIVKHAEQAGAHSPEEKRRLRDASERLLLAGHPLVAATGFQLLGDLPSLAKALEEAGEVERLEVLLTDQAQKERKESQLRDHIGTYKMAMNHGARVEAVAALRKAVELTPEDRDLSLMLQNTLNSFPPPHRVALSIDGKRNLFAAARSLTLGRSGADVVVRGTSVSRVHARVGVLDGGGVRVSDCDSRNGTLLSGVPIAQPLELSGPAEVGLGDDVTIDVRPDGSSAFSVTVKSGLDRGVCVAAGEGALRVEGIPFAVDFSDGHARVTADPGVEMFLGAQKSALPIVLLIGDQIAVGPHSIEVQAW